MHSMASGMIGIGRATAASSPATGAELNAGRQINLFFLGSPNAAPWVRLGVHLTPRR